MTRGRRFAAIAAIAVLLAPALGVWACLRSQERRLERLEAALAADLEAERKRGPVRLPWREPGGDGEMLAAVTSAVRAFTPGRRDECARVPALRAALAVERFEPDWDIEREWRSQGSAWLTGQDYERLEAALEALRLQTSLRLESDPREAARLVVDAWRLRHLLMRFGRVRQVEVAMQIPGVGAGTFPSLLAGLDREECAELTSALETLESTRPSFADAIHRERLGAGCFFRAVHRGEVTDASYDFPDTIPPGASLFARAKKRLLRASTIADGWELVDRELGAFETDAARLPPRELADRLASAPEHSSGWLRLPTDVFQLDIAVDGAGPSVAQAHRLWQKDLDELRLFRLAARARAFWLERGRYPTSLREALGRGPAAGEIDPFTGAPFDLRIREGWLVLPWWGGATETWLELPPG